MPEMRMKVLIVVVALILGGFAAVLAANYVRGARADVAEESESVTVLVAQEDLPRGMTAEDLVERELVAEEEIPRRFVSADAVSSARVLENQVLAVPVSAGEQLTKTRFQYPAQAGLAYSVPEDYVALSVTVDDVSGVAGLLKPGDNVVVYATFQPQAADAEPFTMMLVARARVLAVGEEISAEPTAEASEQENAGALAASQAASGAQRGSPSYGSVTLALSVADAERAVFGEEEGSLHLALLPKNAEEPAAPSPTGLGSGISGTLTSIVE